MKLTEKDTQELENLLEEYGYEVKDLKILFKYLEQAKEKYKLQDFVLAKHYEIEVKLGIDLVTFFRIRQHCYDRKPIFYKEKGKIKQSSSRVELCCYCVAVHVGDYGADYYQFKSYGKTWALTIEELL